MHSVNNSCVCWLIFIEIRRKYGVNVNSGTGYSAWIYQSGFAVYWTLFLGANIAVGKHAKQLDTFCAGEH